MEEWLKNKWKIIGIILSIGTIITLTGGCINISEWPTQINHKLNLTSTIDPWHPKISELNAELEENLAWTDYSSAEDRLHIELRELKFLIDEKIPYTPDLENPNHPAVDHYPTISQALEGGDDCDGRAIIACSLLIQRGYNSYTIINDQHAWVIIYLEDGSTEEILRGGYTNQWLLRWNHKQIILNSHHQIICIGTLLLLALLLAKLTLSFLLKNQFTFSI